MTKHVKSLVWAGALLAALLVVSLLLLRSNRRVSTPQVLIGAIVKQDVDPRKESPIADAEISVTNGKIVSITKSNFLGFFRLIMPSGVARGESVTVHFKHPDYKPNELKTTVGEKLNVIRMLPLHGEVEAELNDASVAVANVVVRYSTVASTTENIGTGLKTFEVENVGNVPCNQRAPCSPDGKWKAAIGSASLDAGEGNVFQDARVSCIAGPCPFTKIEQDGFSKPNRYIQVSMRNWSDTTTFLLQAEVFHSSVGDIVRKSYPVIFGRSMNFTLPADAHGPTLEAEMNGSQIIFPVGPRPILSWADCNVRVETNQAKDYRCELKAGYRFR